MWLWRLASPIGWQYRQSRLGDQKEPVSQFKFKGPPLAEFSGSGVSLCSVQAFTWLDGAHPHCGRQSGFKSTDSSVNLIQKLLHRYISKFMFLHINHGTVAQTSWPIKLTITPFVEESCFCLFLLCTRQENSRETQSHPHSFYFF